MPVGSRELKKVKLKDVVDDYEMEFESCMRLADYLKMFYPEKRLTTLRDRCYRAVKMNCKVYRRFYIYYA